MRATAVITTPCIITVAITGSVPRKEHNPAVPITIDEQVDSTRAAFEAGASIAHVHVRKGRPDAHLRPGALCRPAGGIAESLSGH